MVGDDSEREGRLEVCFNQRWGTVNGDGWSSVDTQVACRQLGYETSGEYSLHFVPAIATPIFFIIIIILCTLSRFHIYNYYIIMNLTSQCRYFILVICTLECPVCSDSHGQRRLLWVRN